MEKKKVYFFNLDMNIGGVERQLYYLLNGLNKDRYEVTLILCRKEGSFLKELQKDIKIISLSTAYSRNKKIWIALRLYGLRRVLEDILIQEEEHERDLLGAVED